MHKFHHRPGKSTFVAIGMGSLGLFSCMIGWDEGEVFWLGIGVLCLLGAGKMLADVLSGTPALVVAPQGLSLRKVWGGVADVPWTEVQNIDLEVMTVRYWGIIPIARQRTLLVRCDGGLFGTRRLRLPLNMVELPPGGADALMSLLYRSHVAAVGEAGVAMAGAGEHGWGTRSVASLGERRVAEAEGGGFDPDAALARYLARKETGSELPAARPTPSPPPRPMFGRKSQAG
jgi:hypothetical protein